MSEDEAEQTPPISIMSMLQANPPPDALPDGWIMHRSRSQPGYSYYFNQFTGECQWESPYIPPKLTQLEGLKETLASLTKVANTNRNSNGNDNDHDNSNEDNVSTSPSKKSSVRSILKKAPSDNDMDEDDTNDNNNTSSTDTKLSPKKKRSLNQPTSSSSPHHQHSSKKSKAPSSSSSNLPDKVRALHILKKHRESRRPSSWRQAKITITKKEASAELQELIAILQDVSADPKELRATFEELAKTESDCTSAKRGGDLGFFGRKKMQPNFEKASFALGVGEMSGVVETSSGVHVILRLA